MRVIRLGKRLLTHTYILVHTAVLEQCSDGLADGRAKVVLERGERRVGRRNCSRGARDLDNPLLLCVFQPELILSAAPKMDAQFISWFLSTYALLDAALKKIGRKVELLPVHASPRDLV